jgi:hypothetical protein
MPLKEPEHVWLVPQKFWAATKEMPGEDVEKLVERLMSLSAARDFDSLQKFDFIVIGDVDFNRSAP